MKTLKGLRKASKPRIGAIWAPAVSVAMEDPAENAAALEAVRRTAGDWLEDGKWGGLQRPREANVGGPALVHEFQCLQDRCHQAAYDAVMRIRDPDYESPEEIRVRETAEESALDERRRLVVNWAWKASGEDLAAAERLIP